MVESNGTLLKFMFSSFALFGFLTTFSSFYEVHCVHATKLDQRIVCVGDSCRGDVCHFQSGFT